MASVAKEEKSYFKFMKFGANTRLSLFMLLKHKSLFFAKKDVLNDPTDCKPFLYVDLDEEKCLSKLNDLIESMKASSSASSYWQRQAQRLLEFRLATSDSSKENAKRPISRNFYFNGKYHTEYGPAILEEFISRYFSYLIDDAKIFSMARIWHEPRLWAHYAEGHKGLCLELTGLEQLPEAVVSGFVDYTSRRPRVSVSDLIAIQGRGNIQHKQETLSRLYLQKSIGWEYEKENRLFLAKSDFDKIKPVLRLPEGDYIRCDKVKIKSITLGLNSSEYDYRMISVFVDDFIDKRHYPAIYRIRQNDDDYDLSREEVHSDDFFEF
ncbi:MAG: DUF2971 domain-containing protein [Proteobacteria bacterium]|nr:DUF2971 domain-containing protein [Pseudomonadota bacterium]